MAFNGRFKNSRKENTFSSLTGQKLEILFLLSVHLSKGQTAIISAAYRKMQPDRPIIYSFLRCWGVICANSFTSVGGILSTLVALFFVFLHKFLFRFITIFLKANYIVIKLQPFNVSCPLKGHTFWKQTHSCKVAGLFKHARPPQWTPVLKGLKTSILKY